MKKLFNSYLFWHCSLVEYANGFWYHEWKNIVTKESHLIFAGYSRKVLNEKRSTWNTLQSMIKED